MSATQLFLDRVLLVRSMSKKDFYNMDEVAQILGVKRKRIQRLMTSGSLRGLRVSSARYEGAFADDLDCYLMGISIWSKVPPSKKAATTKAPEGDSLYPRHPTHYPATPEGEMF